MKGDAPPPEDIKHIIETWGWIHKIYTETVDTDDA